MIFDANNGNTNCKDAELLKLKHIYNFDPFDSIRPVASARILPVHTKVQVHLIYDYKKDGRYKSCMVASGNMTGPNLETFYSIVISLHSIPTIVLLSELKNIERRTYDISNAHLTARTKENIVFNSGP